MKNDTFEVHGEQQYQLIPTTAVMASDISIEAKGVLMLLCCIGSISKVCEKEIFRQITTNSKFDDYLNELIIAEYITIDNNLISFTDKLGEVTRNVQ